MSGCVQKIYTQTDVLTAARERIRFVFDRFETIIVSISGGKDSMVMAHLALEEAHRRGRRIGLYYVDPEVVHRATADAVRYLMHLYPDNTDMYWLQIPYHPTNTCSTLDPSFISWDPKCEDRWLRQKEPDSIHSEPWGNTDTRAPSCNTTPLNQAFAAMFERTAFLVGIRADESLHRFKAVSRSPGYNSIPWSCIRDPRYSNVQFYPIYDWTVSDVWRYMYDAGLRYNRIYDYQWTDGVPVRDMRISSLLNAWGLRALSTLPAYEPDTYDRLRERIPGVETAMLYVDEDKLLRARELPAAFNSWRAYRDHLLTTYPDAARRAVFERRFADMPNTERVARQQCRQILSNDQKGRLRVNTKSNRKEVSKKWRALLS